MAWSVPLRLARVRPQLAHFVHSLPLFVRAPAVVTVQDLSFEREPTLMSRKDRLVFRAVVPRGAPRCSRARDLRADQARSRRALPGAVREGRRHAARRRSDLPPEQ